MMRTRVEPLLDGTVEIRFATSTGPDYPRKFKDARPYAITAAQATRLARQLKWAASSAKRMKAGKRQTEKEMVEYLRLEIT